jgi:hypothetical protein
MESYLVMSVHLGDAVHPIKWLLSRRVRTIKVLPHDGHEAGTMYTGRAL